jgi:hypothetical protein
MGEVLVISTINFSIKNLKKRFILVNRAQPRNYKTTRDRMIGRIMRKPELADHVKSNPFIVPQIILEDSNAIQTWASFKFENADKFFVENGIISVIIKDFKLIESLCSFIGIQRKPIDQLKKEYDDLLNCKYEDEIYEF